jgi:hypothetical protein
MRYLGARMYTLLDVHAVTALQGRGFPWIVSGCYSGLVLTNHQQLFESAKGFYRVMLEIGSCIKAISLRTTLKTFLCAV